MCLCCFLNLYQPFMELWVGKDLMLSMGAVVCFCVYFYIQEINKLFNTYKDASGIWHEDRFRPLVVALTNLCLNLLMVNFWGIYGILLSTVFATLFVGMVEDEEGFEYPQIDESKCVRCYQCLKVCPFKVAKASGM